MNHLPLRINSKVLVIIGALIFALVACQCSILSYELCGIDVPGFYDEFPPTNILDPAGQAACLDFIWDTCPEPDTSVEGAIEGYNNCQIAAAQAFYSPYDDYPTPTLGYPTVGQQGAPNGINPDALNPITALIAPDPGGDATATPVPFTVNCAAFRLTSPLDGLPNGVAAFYWDPIQNGQTYSYRFRIFDEASGTPLVTFGGGYDTNTTQGNVAQSAIGGGFSLRVRLEALNSNGQVVCSDEHVLLRAATETNNPPPVQNNPTPTPTIPIPR
jgi:hypothetical protein